MIHDDLNRHFQSLPEPSLSPHFAITLRQRLRAASPPARPAPAFVRVWATRLYWIAAVALVLRYWETPTVTPTQIAGLGIAGLAVVVVLTRALRPWPLTRILWEALLR